MGPSLTVVPEHIGIILDGNRRFAKKLKINPFKGHDLGYEKVKKLFVWCKEFNIKELTLFAFSIENFDRPKQEVDYLMNLFDKAFSELIKDKSLEEIKIKFIGRIYLFPEKIQELMLEIVNITKNNTGLIINFAMAYGGRAEIVDATKKIAQQVKVGKINIDQINEDILKNNLYLSSEPDLIIRTSESRLSGFLTFQSIYSEIIFLPDKLWPEFEKKDFIKCLKEYSNRQRRFGK